jgi:hypothetical protein
VSERRAGLETGNVGADPPVIRGRPLLAGVSRATKPRRSHRGMGDGMHDEEIDRNTGSPCGEGRDPQPTSREGQVGPQWVADRPVVARRSGNAEGAKGP